jgi:hypothetical protein
MRDVIAVRRFGAAARRLTGRLINDFQTTTVLLFLRVSLPLLKRVVAVRRLIVWLSTRPAKIHANGDRASRISCAIATIHHGGGLLIGSNCLERSLAAYWMLRRAGASPRLVLGAKRRDGELAGHAWIELGTVVFETHAGEFVHIASFGGD